MARCPAKGPSTSGISPAARRYDRSPSTIGPKGDVPPWTAMPSKICTSERIKVFLANVVLPTPASPASRTSDPCPAMASVTHASSWARSGSRPISSSCTPSFSGATQNRRH